MFPQKLKDALFPKSGLAFYGQVYLKGEGRRSPPWALTVSKCENLDPFFFIGI